MTESLDAAALEERLTELEIQLSYANERIALLDESLRAHELKSHALEEELRLLREALKRVGRPSEGGLDPDPFNDPVPSSG